MPAFFYRFWGSNSGPVPTTQHHHSGKLGFFMIWKSRTLLQHQNYSGGPCTWIRYHTRSLINAPSLILMTWDYLQPSLRQWQFFRLEYPDAARLGDPAQAVEYLRCKQSYQWVAILCHAAKDRNSFGKFRSWAEMKEPRAVEGWGRVKW